jgi:transposase-like protein
MTQDITSTKVVPFPFDSREVIRGRIRETIEEVLREELAQALAAKPSERTDNRVGYRNGFIERQVVTEYGSRALKIPRGRIHEGDGSCSEWRSEVLPRYQRRTKRVDEAILGCYFAGANSRRIRKALAPLLGERNLSKSAISRLVRKLKVRFEAWRTRDLSGELYQYLYLDATNLPVRLARRVVRVPVLVVIGVRPDGNKALVSLQIARSESTAAWRSMMDDLVGRGLLPPSLVVVDGNAGLRRALEEVWPRTPVQRCTKHKWENLRSRAPKHAHGEMKRDYDAIIYAENLERAFLARRSFVGKWSPISKEAVRSLEEAGDELLAFYRFPKSQWKCLRTTNPIEGVNSAFKRRTKTQGAFTNEESALVLFYGLFATEQIQLRKIDGWKDLKEVNLPRLQSVA